MSVNCYAGLPASCARDAGVVFLLVPPGLFDGFGCCARTKAKVSLELLDYVLRALLRDVVLVERLRRAAMFLEDEDPTASCLNVPLHSDDETSGHAVVPFDGVERRSETRLFVAGFQPIGGGPSRERAQLGEACGN
jgi:hypothetical protein